jgi:hypothetical protein
MCVCVVFVSWMRLNFVPLRVVLGALGALRLLSIDKIHSACSRCFRFLALAFHPCNLIFFAIRALVDCNGFSWSGFGRHCRLAALMHVAGSNRVNGGDIPEKVTWPWPDVAVKVPAYLVLIKENYMELAGACFLRASEAL